MSRSLFVLAFALISPGAPAPAQKLTLQIPPVTTRVNIENHPIAITAGGVISGVSRSGDLEVLRLRLHADLADLQANATALLRSQLDRSDRCGERIAVQDASLTPVDPSSLLTTHLHYERWVCAKAFGRQMTKKLVGGNAVVQVKLTPTVDAAGAVRLTPEIARIDADGTLGDLLHSSTIGPILRDKIHAALLSAVQKGTNFNATLPPAVQDVARIQRVQFTGAGTGRLGVEVVGEIRLPHARLPLLIDQLKARPPRVTMVPGANR